MAKYFIYSYYAALVLTIGIFIVSIVFKSWYGLIPSLVGMITAIYYIVKENKKHNGDTEKNLNTE